VNEMLRTIAKPPNDHIFPTGKHNRIYVLVDIRQVC